MNVPTIDEYKQYASEYAKQATYINCVIETNLSNSAKPSVNAENFEALKEISTTALNEFKEALNAFEAEIDNEFDHITLGESERAVFTKFSSCTHDLYTNILEASRMPGENAEMLNKSAVELNAKFAEFVKLSQ